MSNLMKNTSGKLIVVLVTLLISACGVPEGLTVRNLVNATVTPVQSQVAVTSGTAGATVAAPVASVTTAPTQDQMGNMSGMGATQQAQPTTAGNTVQPTATGTGGYVAIWLLGGTPTPTGNALGSDTAATLMSMMGTSSATQAAPNAPTPTLGPTRIPATVGPGDPAKGKELFNGVAPCYTCHDVSQGIVIVGPSLKGVASRAGSRKPGMSAEDYLRESITNPNAFVVPNFPAGTMPQNFAQILTPQQINDLIAYLMTLK